MSGSKQTEGRGGSLPDDIAAESGLPRVDDVERSLHAIDERVGTEAEALAAAVGDRVDGARGSAETTARDAADAVGDAADSVRGRLRGAADEAGARAVDARDRASDAYDDVRTWASDRYDEHRSRASDLADRGYRTLRHGRSATEDFVSENPLLVGVVGLAAGLLLGALLPRTRQETEALGPWADEARDQGLRYARDVTQQGRAFVERVLDPDNIEAAAKRGADADDETYGGSERTAHRL